MNKAAYEEEMMLIREQNDTEFEIYPMIVDIIKPTLKNLSKRYVFARRRSPKGQIYYGISSFPDVAIIDKDFKNTPKEKITKNDWKKLKGCIEVKTLGLSLISEEKIKEVLSIKTRPKKIRKGIGQLIGEILWYKKMIYTNGVEWRYLYVEEYTNELIENIVKTVNDRIVFENKKTKEEFNWWNEFKNIDFNIVDECITKDCNDNWEDFIDKISQIKWD